jgi:hypothetical protein
MLQTPSAIQRKPSKSIPIWLTLIAAVLTCLYLQMGSGGSSYNFLIESGSDAEGAQVTVDGKPMGSLAAQSDAGVKVIALRLQLADGEHNIEVTKPGFQPQKVTMFIKGEDFLAVDLKQQ